MTISNKWRYTLRSLKQRQRTLSSGRCHSSTLQHVRQQTHKYRDVITQSCPTLCTLISSSRPLFMWNSPDKTWRAIFSSRDLPEFRLNWISVLQARSLIVSLMCRASPVGFPMGFPDGSWYKRICLQCRDSGLILGWEDPLEKELLPTWYFCLENSYGQRSLGRYVHGVQRVRYELTSYYAYTHISIFGQEIYRPLGQS